MHTAIIAEHIIIVVFNIHVLMSVTFVYDMVSLGYVRLYTVYIYNIIQELSIALYVLTYSYILHLTRRHGEHRHV